MGSAITGATAATEASISDQDYHITHRSKVEADLTVTFTNGTRQTFQLRAAITQPFIELDEASSTAYDFGKVSVRVKVEVRASARAALTPTPTLTPTITLTLTLTLILTLTRYAPLPRGMALLQLQPVSGPSQGGTVTQP